jgi:hypothetical protein
MFVAMIAGLMILAMPLAIVRRLLQLTHTTLQRKHTTLQRNRWATNSRKRGRPAGCS